MKLFYVGVERGKMGLEITIRTVFPRPRKYVKNWFFKCSAFSTHCRNLVFFNFLMIIFKEKYIMSNSPLKC